MSDFYPIHRELVDRFDPADQHIEVVRSYNYKCRHCGWTPPEHSGCIPAMERHLQEQHGVEGKTLWICARLHADFVREVERLLAIVDKQPKCQRLDENGKLVRDVPVHIGMDVWVDDEGSVFRATVIDASLQGVAHLQFHNQRIGEYDIETELYSTREAAESTADDQVTAEVYGDASDE